MTPDQRDTLIARAKQLGELSSSLLTAAYTRDDAMLFRIAGELGGIGHEVNHAASTIQDEKIRQKAEVPKEEPKSEPKVNSATWTSFDAASVKFTFHFKAEDVRAAFNQRDHQEQQRRANEEHARRQKEWQRQQQQQTETIIIRRLVNLCGASYTAGMTTDEMVRAAQRVTHPDTPGGSAELFKEVTKIAQTLGVFDRRGQRVG